MRKNLKVFLTVIIAVILTGSIAYGVYRIFFMPNNTVVPAFAEGKLNVVIEDKVPDDKGEPRVVEDRILLPLALIKELIDPEISWDSALHKLTVTTKKSVIRMKTGSLEAFINNKPANLNVPATEENGEVFVPIEFLSGFYGIDTEYNKENNVIIIDFKNSKRQYAEPVDQEAVIRTGSSIFEPIVKKLDSQNKNFLRIYEENEKWYKVRASDGTIGYIEKKFVKLIDMPAENTVPDNITESVWRPQDGKISMAWDYAYNLKTNLDKRPAVKGLDVISPTWFQVVGENGELKNHADIKYVEWAHSKGYEVWALFSNNFGDAVKTGNFLNNTDARDNAIRQLLSLSALYKLDGINIDFEGLQNSDKGALTQFVRELAPILHEQGLVISIDINTLPCYDRKGLGEAVDYVALMAYDQYWSGSSEAGSVSQLSWVDSIVRLFLKDVPAEKLILGVPFYTRLWKETPQDGKIELTSQAFSMKRMEEIMKENNAQKSWDSESGQFYSQFIKDGATFKVWLEDENSLNLRTSLVHKFKLAGASAWRLDFEEPGVWDIINRNLKVYGNYAEWKQHQDGQYAYND